MPHTVVTTQRNSSGTAKQGPEGGISNIKLSLQVEPSPDLLHPSLPLPLQRVLALTPSAADALIDAAELHIQVGAQRLEADAHLLEALDLLALDAGDGLLGGPLVAEHVAVAPDHDEVALVVHRHHLPALDLGLRRVERVEGLAD